MLRLLITVSAISLSNSISSRLFLTLPICGPLSLSICTKDYLPQALHHRNFCNTVRKSMMQVDNSNEVPKLIHKDNQGPIVLGLTGSIGMGKSTITKQLRRLGFAVFDADEAVHQLYSFGGEAVEKLKAKFPSSIENGAVNRKALMEVIMSSPEAIKEIELIVHPLVHEKRSQFLEVARQRGDLLIIYDIPLLFESGQEDTVDYILVVTADPATQKRRVLQRPGMTEEKFLSILSKQCSDEVKRKKAHYVISTGYDGYAEGRSQLASALSDIIDKESRRWEQWTLSNKIYRSSSTDEYKKFEIEAVIFDLDDTLVPTYGPINAALEALQLFAKENMPRTSEVLSSRLKEGMSRTARENPLVAHDLTELRRRALYKVAFEFDEHDHVDKAMDILLEERSKVDAYLYNDSLLCMDSFHKEGLRMGILTNGNANVEKCDAFRPYNLLCLGAADIGAAKPSPVGFIACAQLLGLAPNKILYIGDDYVKDIEGAKRVGMHTAFIARPKKDASAVAGEKNVVDEATRLATYPAADIVVSSLSPEEILQRFLKKSH